MRRIFLSALFALLPLALQSEGLAPGDTVPLFRLTDHLGRTRALNYQSEAKAVVLIFTAANSPRAIQVSSAIRALQARFAATDVVIWQIDSNAGASRPVIAADQWLNNSDVPVLLDEAQLVATELGATRHGEAFVIDTFGWRLAYRGLLDDASPASQATPAHSYVMDAVDAVCAGRSPATTRADPPDTAPALDLPPATVPDYAAEVAPVVIRRCLSCHSTGNIAPHVFASYTDLAARASSIRADMLLKRMAPWHADPQHGAFSNAVALTPAETATLHAWARAGAPRGSATDPLPAAVPPVSGNWPLGTPDLIVSIPRQSIPATGTVSYRYLTVSAPVPAGRWLRAAVVRPGNTRVVHHALVFEGTILDVLLNSGGLGGFFAGYVPGLEQTWYPDGVGKQLGSAQVTFQMHYTTTGTAETDTTQLGLYYATGIPEKRLLTKAASTTDITIPPGTKEYTRSATFTPSATKDVLLYELNPHMHYRGKYFRYDALYPDGTTETLLNVPQYDFHWQSQYRLAAPKRLPAGTIIRASGAFDNSDLNDDNPNPAATVAFGEQTNDEMFIGYLNYAELSDLAAMAPPRLPGTIRARARTGEPFYLPITTDGVAPAIWRSDSLPAGLALDSATGVISGTPAAAGRSAVVIAADNAAGTAKTLLDLHITAPPAAPVFTTTPRSVRAASGSTVTLSAFVSAASAPTWQWQFNGQNIAGATTSSLTLPNITGAAAGDYTCIATNPAGSARATATVTVGFTGLANLSARASVGTGDKVVIPGLVVRGTQPKTLLIRAAGPALAGYGVSGVLPDPLISVFDINRQKILANDDWAQSPNLPGLATATAGLGAFDFPAGGRDAAMLVTVPPGLYTVQVAGAGATATGVALVEVYDADGTPGQLVDISCRAHVGIGSDVLIAGFVVSGSEPKKVLIRGVGPTLANYGLTGVLTDPQLAIFRQGTAAPIATNDDWAGAAPLSAAFTATGAFALPAASKDAALLLTLEPGVYSAHVTGANNSTGLALVEVYDAP